MPAIHLRCLGAESTVLFESTILVDTSIHNSNNRATFHNCCHCNNLCNVVPVALPPIWAQNDPLPALASDFDALATGKTASLARKQEAQP